MLSTSETDRTIPNTKQHIIIRLNEKETCLPRGNAILGDRNVIKIEAKMTLERTTEIQHIMNVKDKGDTSRLIIGTNGTNSSHSENIWTKCPERTARHYRKHTCRLHTEYCTYIREILHVPYIVVGRVAQSVQRLTTGWTVRDRIPVGTRFSARPDRPWGPSSLL